MTDDEDAEIRYWKAIARFRQGLCPACGRSVGDAKGLERRRRSLDSYCHMYKKAWSVEIDALELRDEFCQFYETTVQATQPGCVPGIVQLYSIS